MKPNSFPRWILPIFLTCLIINGNFLIHLPQLLKMRANVVEADEAYRDARSAYDYWVAGQMYAELLQAYPSSRCLYAHCIKSHLLAGEQRKAEKYVSEVREKNLYLDGDEIDYLIDRQKRERLFMIRWNK